MAARPDRAVVARSISSSRSHRLAAVRRRAAARLHAPVHQGARPLERARRDQRDQGRAQGARREPVRQHRAHDGRARRARARAARDRASTRRSDGAHESLRDRVTSLPVRVGERIGLLEPRPAGLAEARDRRATRSAGTSTRRTCAPSSTRSRDLAKSAIETAADKQAYPGRDRAAPRARARRATASASCRAARRRCARCSPPSSRSTASSTTSSSSRTTSRTSCAAGSARCARRSRTSCRRCCSSRIGATARARDPVRRRRRGRRDHLLPVRRPRRRRVSA